MPLGKMLGIPESARNYEASTKLVLSRCLTGLEFECENVAKELPVEGTAGLWRMEKDGSLRGAGMEFVLREPLFGEDLISSVDWFCDWAKENRFEVNFRTGLHVHVDMRNVNSEQLLTMLVFYALYEPLIYKWVGDDREGSIFCLPFYKAEGAVHTIAQALKSTSRMKDYLARVDRYAGLNLNALSKYGSVEWRHLMCTFDKERIVKWINVAQSFKKYAKKNPLEPKELLAIISHNGVEALFSDILGPLYKEFWFAGAEKVVWSTGFPIAQDISMLMAEDLNIKWDTVRQALRAGTNPGFLKWADKAKDKKQDEVPDNLFENPDLLADPEMQRLAIERLKQMIRASLDATPNPA